MKFGVPWSVKGIRPEARETAKEAARRSGMSLGDWLNAVIIHQAAQEGVQAPSLVDDDARRRRHRHGQRAARRPHPPHRAAHAHGAGGLRAEAQPQRTRSARRTDRPARPAARSIRQCRAAVRLPPPAMPPSAERALPPSLDRAVAEIAARQRTLNAYAAPPAAHRQRAQEPPRHHRPAPAPTPCRQRPPPSRAAPPAGAGPVGPGRSAPQYHRPDRDAAQAGRRAGDQRAARGARRDRPHAQRRDAAARDRRHRKADPGPRPSASPKAARPASTPTRSAASSTGLPKCATRLRGLTPAENLVGFNDAVAGLAHKIDLIVAQKDPATLAQLENAITTLREMTDAYRLQRHRARSSPPQVQRSARRSSTSPHAADRRRRARPSRASHRRARRRAGRARAKRRRGAAAAGSAGGVADRQDRADADTRAATTTPSAISRTASSSWWRSWTLPIPGSAIWKRSSAASPICWCTSRTCGPTRTPAACARRASPAVDDLKHDIARTQDALEAVHGTLGHVVDRLAMIEKDIRGETRRAPRRRREPTAAPVGSSRPRGRRRRPPLRLPMPRRQLPPAPPPAPPHRAAAPRRRAAAPAGRPAADRSRSAARSAARARLRPAAFARQSGRAHCRFGSRARRRRARAAAPGGKSSFIAAARRAAQAAVQQRRARRAPRAEAVAEPQEPRRPIAARAS